MAGAGDTVAGTVAGATMPLGAGAAVWSVAEVESPAITPTTVPTIAHRPITTKLITARMRPRRCLFLVRMTPQMPSGTETSPRLGIAVINAIIDTVSNGGFAGGVPSSDGICSGSVPAATSVVAGADGGGLQSCGVQSAASACPVSRRRRKRLGRWPVSRLVRLVR